MTMTSWGPALDAEIAYRQERARLAWPQRRRAPRRTASVARPAVQAAAPAPVPQDDCAPSAPAALRALDGGGARRRSLPGSEAWPAA